MFRSFVAHSSVLCVPALYIVTYHDKRNFVVACPRQHLHTVHHYLNSQAKVVAECSGRPRPLSRKDGKWPRRNASAPPGSPSRLFAFSDSVRLAPECHRGWAITSRTYGVLLSPLPRLRHCLLVLFFPFLLLLLFSTVSRFLIFFLFSVILSSLLLVLLPLLHYRLQLVARQPRGRALFAP